MCYKLVSSQLLLVLNDITRCLYVVDCSFTDVHLRQWVEPNEAGWFSDWWGVDFKIKEPNCEDFSA